MTSVEKYSRQVRESPVSYVCPAANESLIPTPHNSLPGIRHPAHAARPHRCCDQDLPHGPLHARDNHREAADLPGRAPAPVPVRAAVRRAEEVCLLSSLTQPGLLILILLFGNCYSFMIFPPEIRLAPWQGNCTKERWRCEQLGRQSMSIYVLLSVSIIFISFCIILFALVARTNCITMNKMKWKQ